jgi:anti-sigma regulatory factor (Ser/Thr protein kinase)
VRSTARPLPVPHPPRRSSSASAAISPSHHGHDLQHWPLRDTLTLGALVDAVPSARAHVRQLLSGWGHAEVGPDASLAVSELVTNSVVASAELRTAAPVLIWLGSDSNWLLLAVADASPQPPVRLNLGPEAERGRGLGLVEALSNRWGWHPASTTGLRKVTWVEWRLSSGSAGGQVPTHRIATMQPDQREQPSRLLLGPLETSDLAVNVPTQSGPLMPPGGGGDNAGVAGVVPGPGRSHDVSRLTGAELERTRRELQASLALARPGSASSVPILAHLGAIEVGLARRSADCGASGKPSGLGARTSASALDMSIPLSSAIRGRRG